MASLPLKGGRCVCRGGNHSTPPEQPTRHTRDMQVTRHRCDFRWPAGAAIASASAPLVGRELWAMLLDEAFRVLPTMVAKGVAPGEVAARQLSGAVQRTLDHTTPSQALGEPG